MAFLEIKNLKKSFGKTAVLHGIDFSMEKGEVTCVIGSSGGGKTTFLRCINFLERANEGTITIENAFHFDAAREYTAAEIREMTLKLGLVFQQFNLFPQYSALENVYIPLQLRSKEKIRKAVPFGKKRREAIKEAEIASQVSYSAGAYVCNDLLYALLAHFEGTQTRVGFVHIPYAKEQGKEPSMELSEMIRGLTVAIENIDT